MATITHEMLFNCVESGTIRGDALTLAIERVGTDTFRIVLTDPETGKVFFVMDSFELMPGETATICGMKIKLDTTAI